MLFKGGEHGSSYTSWLHILRFPLMGLPWKGNLDMSSWNGGYDGGAASLLDCRLGVCGWLVRMVSDCRFEGEPRDVISDTKYT